MTSSNRDWWRSIVGVGILVFGASSPCLAASSTDELDGLDAAHRGRYFANIPSPDDLTTTKKGKTLKVTDGSWDAERPGDNGLIEFFANGATAVFTGRTVNFGCLYTVNGVYVAKGGAGAPPQWTNEFQEEKIPRLVLEVNESGASDDVVLPGPDGGKLYVSLLNATGAFDVDLAVAPVSTPGGDLSCDPNPVTVAGNGLPSEVALEGIKAGFVKITASTTVEGKTVSASIRAQVLEVQAFITPDDDFYGRSSSRIGVQETGSMCVKVPSGVDLSKLAPFHWSSSNKNVLRVTEDGLTASTGAATFEATDQPGQVTLKVSYSGGTLTYLVEVITPSGFVYVPMPNAVKHDEGVASVGFRATVYLRPTDVSFSKIKYGEGMSDATVHGYFAIRKSGNKHQANGPYDISEGNIFTGCHYYDFDWIACNATDWAFTSTGLGPSGYLIWNIPQRWSCDGLEPWHVIGKAEQTFNVTAAGTMSAQKAGAGPVARAFTAPDEHPDWTWSPPGVP